MKNKYFYRTLPTQQNKQKIKIQQILNFVPHLNLESEVKKYYLNKRCSQCKNHDPFEPLTYCSTNAIL